MPSMNRGDWYTVTGPVLTNNNQAKFSEQLGSSSIKKKNQKTGASRRDGAANPNLNYEVEEET